MAANKYPVEAGGEITVNCTPAQAWDFMVNNFLVNYPRWSPETKVLKAMSPGPLKLGWRGYQERVDQGYKLTSNFEITRMEDLHLIEFQGKEKKFLIVYEFLEADGQLHIKYTFALKSVDLMLRPFIGMVNNVVQTTTQQMLKSLQKMLETEVAA